MQIFYPKYFDKLVFHIKGILTLEHNHGYEVILSILENVKTKRLIFDARQAIVFDKSGPISLPGDKIKSPFDQFYLELTELIEVDGQEPGFRDKLVAIIYLDQNGDVPVETEIGLQHINASACVFIFFNEDTNQWVDRTFRLCLETKTAVCAVLNATQIYHQPKTNYGDNRHRDPSDLPADWDKSKYFIPNMKISSMPNRHIGWWENAIQEHVELVLWIFAYTMAKSVKIEEIKLSRQMRRFNDRKGYIPRPWHRVFVEPKLVDKKISLEKGERQEVGFRFDVIQHLRFNKHKLLDGSYRYTIELVPSHQRGLKHEIYIPKTYVIEKGKKFLKENEQYFGDTFKKEKINE